jgi:hypothetical protein
MHLNKVPLITHVTELSVLPNKLYLPHDHGDSTRSICPAGPISIGAGLSRSKFPAAGEEHGANVTPPTRSKDSIYTSLSTSYIT